MYVLTGNMLENILKITVFNITFSFPILANYQFIITSFFFFTLSFKMPSLDQNSPFLVKSYWQLTGSDVYLSYL